MTKRASLSQRERRDMWDAQGHKCDLCFEPIGLHDCIAEHWVTVESGNDQKPDCLLCIPCAHRKTYGTKATSYGSDTHERSKVKRILRKAAGTWKPNRQKIQSRGFQKRPADSPYQWPTRKLWRPF